MHKWKRLLTDDAEKLIDPELIFIKNIIKSESHEYLCDPRANTTLIGPFIEKALEVLSKKPKDVCFEVYLPLHMPLNLEDALLDRTQGILD